MIWYQGWLTLPDKFKENIESIRRQNPDWELMQWDENSIKPLIASLGDEYVQKFNSFTKLHQKIDFARYAALYKFGGCSVDVDCYAIKGFDSTPQINDANLIVSYNSLGNRINNATILASKENPILKGMLDEISNNCTFYDTNFSCIFKTTGPSFFTKYLQKYKDQVVILDNSYFEPCYGGDKHCEVKSNSILDHRHEGSWAEPGIKGAAKAYHASKQYIPTLIVLLFIVILIVIAKYGKVTT